MSFRRFAVVGSQPEAIDQALLDRLAEHVLGADPLGAIEADYGFCGGRHVFDDQFTFDNNVYADALHLGLRVDTNKVPHELAKAYQIIEQDAAAKDNPSGFISKKQKTEARQTAKDRVERELGSGKHRRSKMTPLIWDLPQSVLYCNVSGETQEKLIELFQRVLELELIPLSSGALALRMLESKGKRRDYEDARPTRFVNGPEGESQSAEYPWVAKGPEAKDYLGNEFLLWLWQQAESDEGGVNFGNRHITLFFDRTLDLDCVFGQTGRDSLRADGVTKMPEALDGLRSGKVPRKAGLIIESSGMQYTLTISAESLAVGSLKLPPIEDPANPRVLFEERIAMLRDFSNVFDALFETFLKSRAGGSWESQTGAIRKWITHPKRPAVALAV